MIIYCSLLLLLVPALRPVRAETDEVLIAQVMDWARANGAYINDKVEVRNIANEHGLLSGIFAKEDLEEDEVVCTIPWDLILKPEGEELEGEWGCDTIWAIHEAITKDETLQTPYEKYLAARTRNHLPAFWSDQGKTILKRLIGDHLPTMGFDTMTEDYLETCGYDDEASRADERTLNAIMLFLTRSEGPDGEHLIPFHDIINHRNGNGFNTDPHVDYGEHYQLVTRRSVKAGEQLQNSYNQCQWCEIFSNPVSDARFIVTPQIFELYGFVEFMPQRWVIPKVRLMFDIDEKENDDGSQDQDGELEVNFPVPPSERALSFIGEELERLKTFELQHKNQSTATAVPENELASIWQYHNAIVVALTHAQNSAKEQTSGQVWSQGRYWYWEEEEYDEEEEAGGWDEEF